MWQGRTGILFIKNKTRKEKREELILHIDPHMTQESGEHNPHDTLLKCVA